MRKTIFGIFFALFASASAQNAGEILFGYDYGEGSTFTMGTSKTENYDAGYLLKDASLVGLKVEGVQIPLPDTTGITGLRAWLSTALTKTTVDGKRTIQADIESVDANVEEGTVEVRFSEPYTLTADGVYVGYSFKLASLNAYPIVLTTTSADVGGFYLMTSRTYLKFTDVTKTFGGALAMKTILSGAAANAAGSADLGEKSGKVSTDLTLSVPVKNHGSAEISSIDYTYTFNGQSVSGTQTFATPIPTQFGASQTFDITLTLPDAAGAYPFSLTIEKVNGEANTDASPTATATINALNVLPTHRPLMEEYTGTWCGWCVRGLYAMELMRETYGDRFVGVALHNGDDMEIMASSAFPSMGSGFPCASLERTLTNIDPYYGTNFSVDFYIAKDWEGLAAEMAPAELNVEAAWNADGTIGVTATANFPAALSDNPYRIGFYIVADDLHKATWYQSNYYAGGGSGEMGGFENESQYILDYHFNDVAIYALDYKTGNAASLPAGVAAETPYDYSVSINAGDMVNTSGETIMQDADKLYAVAMLIDSKTGVVKNAAKAHVEDAAVVTGLSQVTGHRSQVANIYGIDGKRRAKVGQGVNIVRYSDGSTRKIIR